MGVDIRVTHAIGTSLIVSGTVGGTYVALLSTKNAFAGATKRDLSLETYYDPTINSSKIVTTQRVGVELVLPKGVVAIGCVAA